MRRVVMGLWACAADYNSIAQGATGRASRPREKENGGKLAPDGSHDVALVGGARGAADAGPGRSMQLQPSVTMQLDRPLDTNIPSGGARRAAHPIRICSRADFALVARGLLRSWHGGMEERQQVQICRGRAVSRNDRKVSALCVHCLPVPGSRALIANFLQTNARKYTKLHELDDDHKLQISDN